MEKTHWRSHDFRKESLIITLNGLKESIDYLKKKYEEIEWYDGIFFIEEVEPIYGLALIDFQNYINSTVYDLDESLNRKIEFYKAGNKLKEYEGTDIELIIALANYFKHRDDDKTIHKGTSMTLDKFNLDYSECVDIVASPIMRGIELITSDSNLRNVAKIVFDWRESLWEKRIEENQPQR